MNLLKKIIALVSFAAFIAIGVLIFYRQQNLKKNAFDKSGILDIDDYYLSLEKREKTSLGIYNKRNEDKILSSTNESLKEDIIKLISRYNSGDIQNISEDYKNEVYELLEKSKIKFIGDSNTEHFKFYDILDEKYYFAMTGKNIDEQYDIINEEVFKDVDNLVFFNGYNLDKYDNADEYINSYKKLFDKIKSINNSINIYVCSLLPATKKAIEEDIASPLPHKIYNGIKFDLSLESFSFDNAEYIDTKWFMEEEKHKSDGVHMEKYFYEILLPYVCLYVNLDNASIKIGEENASKQKEKVYYLTDENNREAKVDDIALMLNSDEYVSEIIDDDFILKSMGANVNEQYIFDVNDEIRFYTSICGINTVLGLNDVVFVGDSHADRLTRTLAGFITLLARPSRTLRKLEDAYMNAFNMKKKYIVFYTCNNEVKFQTDLIEYRNEYEYIHKLVEQSSVVEDVFICTFFQNNVTKYVKNKEFPYGEEDYDNIIREVCNEYDDMHYIDLSEIHDNKYVLPDGHMGYVYNKKALTKVMRYIYKFDQLKKQKANKEDDNKDNGSENSDKIIAVNDISTTSVAIFQNVMNEKSIKKDFKTFEFASINGKKIEWLVLEEDDESMTLLSKDILGAMPYNKDGSGTTWEKSSIRKYLNSDFYEKIFSNEEKEKILNSELVNNENPDTKTSGGENTSDKVYLLSIDDVKKYFEDENGFAYDSLASKVFDGLNINISKYENANTWYVGNSAFWLRSPGLYDDDASYINYNGSISINGVNVAYIDMGIRPVIKIKK